MNELKLKNNYKNIENDVINKVEEIIKKGNITDPKYKDIIKEYMNSVDFDYCNCIGDYVASLFGVDRSDMLSFDKRENVVRARWMWWLALHFIFKFSYRNIMIIVSIEGNVANKDVICRGISNIQEEMKSNSLLTNKWNIIKKMASADNHFASIEENKENKDIQISVYKKKNTNVKVDLIDII